MLLKISKQLNAESSENFCDLRLANLKNSTSATFYVYQAHFSADKQLVSCTQIDIFDFKITKCTC